MIRPLLAAALLWLTAAGPVVAATRSYSVTSFDRVRIDGGYQVKLATGVSPFARATGSARALDSVSIAVEGRTLVIRANRNAGWGGFPGQSHGPVTVSLGTPELTTAVVNGGSSLAIDRVRALAFDLTVQGAGMAAIDAVAVDRLSIGLAGSAGARAVGRALALKTSVRGAGNLDLSALAAKDATLFAEGPAIIQAAVSNSAKVDAYGVASVTLAGRPSCTVKASGTAAVTGCR